MCIRERLGRRDYVRLLGCMDVRKCIESKHAAKCRKEPENCALARGRVAGNKPISNAALILQQRVEMKSPPTWGYSGKFSRQIE